MAEIKGESLMNRLVGFALGDKKEVEAEEKTLQEIVPKELEEGTTPITSGGAYGTYLDIDGAARGDMELLGRYRQMSLYPECKRAVEEIVNEAIVHTNRIDDIVSVSFSTTLHDMSNKSKKKDINKKVLRIPEAVQDTIRTEFSRVLRMLDFKNQGYELFKRWYVDGRLYLHTLIDTKDFEKGIQEIRTIDPFKIKKVKESDSTISPEEIQQATIQGKLPQVKTKDYFVYSPNGFTNSGTQPSRAYIKIAPDTITQISSGLMNENRSIILSYLHEAIRPLNQLRLTEDAMVIYRISRAPERRIFYVDVGQMPKHRAQQYMNELMARYRNKLVYDANTGEVRDDRRYQTMLEDFWLPRMDGQKGTEISTLPGGQNLGQIEDVEYFQQKLYQSLNVPVSRLASESSGFSIGRSSEITRDELKFKKFIDRLRLRFSILFYELLKRQLILKNVVSEEDWDKIKDDIFFVYKSDVHFEELQNSELMQDRLNVIQLIEPYTGKYYSHDWIRRNVLRQTDEEIKDINEQIEKEEADKQYDAEAAGGEAEADFGGGGFGEESITTQIQDLKTLVETLIEDKK